MHQMYPIANGPHQYIGVSAGWRTKALLMATSDCLANAPILEYIACRLVGRISSDYHSMYHYESLTSVTLEEV